MGNLKLKEFHITSNGEPIYHLVYKATNEIVTPLETLKGMKQLRDDITEAIKENVMKPIEMIWAMFKVYLNNPNYYVKQEDILANVCGNGSRDVRRMMNSLGIHKGDPSTLTYGQLLKQCNII